MKPFQLRQLDECQLGESYNMIMIQPIDKFSQVLLIKYQEGRNK